MTNLKKLSIKVGNTKDPNFFHNFLGFVPNIEEMYIEIWEESSFISIEEITFLKYLENNQFLKSLEIYMKNQNIENMNQIGESIQ